MVESSNSIQVTPQGVRLLELLDLLAWELIRAYGFSSLLLKERTLYERQVL